MWNLQGHHEMSRTQDSCNAVQLSGRNSLISMTTSGLSFSASATEDVQSGLTLDSRYLGYTRSRIMHRNKIMNYGKFSAPSTQRDSGAALRRILVRSLQTPQAAHAVRATSAFDTRSSRSCLGGRCAPCPERRALRFPHDTHTTVLPATKRTARRGPAPNSRPRSVVV